MKLMTRGRGVVRRLVGATRRLAGCAHARPPLLYPHLDGLIPPRDLWVNPQDVFVHYVRWPFEYRAYLVALAGLTVNGSVLDLGCGHGRLALALVDYLRPPDGRYVGLDVQAHPIAWANETVARRYPHFRFVHADTASRHYGAAGSVAAAAYRFPFDDGGFDVVFAASLFTHLLPDAVANYLRESRRVLRPNGRVLISTLLLDAYRRRDGATLAYPFDHAWNGRDDVAVRNADDPESLVAYDASLLERLARDAGYREVAIIPGYWSGSATWALNEHDLLLLG